MRGNGGVVHHNARILHQLITVFDVAGVEGECVYDPEFSQGQIH